MKPSHRCTARVVVLGLLVVVLNGCGWLIDKDRIRIAKIGNEYFTRGDLNDVISRMPDDERPIIQNQGDLLRVLRATIDDRIKQDLSEKLQADKKIDVPREAAAQEFDRLNPEYQRIPEMTNPEDFNLTKYDLAVMKDDRENGIDKLHRKMMGDAAVGYRVRQALEKKQLTITPEELENEYELRKDELHHFEQITFSAIRFTSAPDQARAQAAQVVERVKNGEKFEDILVQYGTSNPDSVIPEAAIENNPSLDKFKGFWQQMHGAETGQVIGPVYMPPSEKVTESGQTEVMPGSVLVLKVLTHTPETTMSKEEAANLLAAPILYAKMIQLLYKEYGVEIYDKNLWDPSFLNEPPMDMGQSQPQPGAM